MSGPSGSAPSTFIATDRDPSTDEQHADALVMADVAAEAVLLLQADAPPGEMAAELRRVQTSSTWSIRLPGWSPCSSTSRSVRRSSVSGPTPSETTVPSLEVARDVVARTLRFDAESGEEDPQREAVLLRPYDLPWISACRTRESTRPKLS